MTAVLALVATELTLRLVGGYGNPRVVLTSARLGYRFHPGQAVPGPNGTVEHLNAHGYRDEEWAEHPPNTSDAPHRIVVLGTSITYGTGVADEAIWPRVLERAMETIPEGGARGYDVVNLAMPGYVVEQLANQYEDDARPLGPDIVIAELSPHMLRPAPVRADASRYPLHAWVRRSAIHDFVQRRRRGDDEPLPKRHVLADPEERVVPRHLERARARMDAMLELVRADGVRLVVLEAPGLGGVLAGSLPPGRETVWGGWAAGHPDVVHLATRDVLREAMAGLLAEIEREGVPPKEVWTRFRAPRELAAAGESLFFQDDPWHLNERGHEVVARTVLDGLRAAGLL